MGQSATSTVAFARPAGTIAARFDLHDVTSDGGLLWLTEAGVFEAAVGGPDGALEEPAG